MFPARRFIGWAELARKPVAQAQASLTPGPFCDVVAVRHRLVQFSQQAGKCQGEKADKTRFTESMQVNYQKGLATFSTSES